jgi:hypothetical protein
MHVLLVHGLGRSPLSMYGLARFLRRQGHSCQLFRASLAPVRTLADVLDWARSRHPPATIDQIVTQDEFTHDVVLPLGDRWIAFDVT